MSPVAIILITISAFSHAFWNFLGKRRDPSVAFFFLANTTAALFLSPIIFYFRMALADVPDQVWGFVLLTGIFQTIYFIGLASAYGRGDMSLAYPLARAVPVLMVTLISLAVGNGHQIGRWGYVGIFWVAMGCLILPLKNFHQFRIKEYITTCVLFALVAAVGTTGYTLIDDAALRVLRGTAETGMSNTESTLLYITLEAFSISLIMGLFLLIRQSERQKVVRLWRSNRFYAGITGIIIASTYGLVLVAMAYVTNVSYVAAFRQLSIPLGAILGMTLQREPRFTPKITGISVAFIGLILLAVG